MLKINPQDLTLPKLQRYLQSSVSPRPIALASTIDKNGIKNLAPFSFYNVFSSNPPILVFSPSRSGRTAEQKDTFNNIKQTGEVVINAVNFKMLHQMNIAGTEYDSDVDEFEKSGFTPVHSEFVKPYRVKESPVQFECDVKQIIELGEKGGAGNLIICEIKLIHIAENILDNNSDIDQFKIDLIARMGGNWYCRANTDSMFEVAKLSSLHGIGIDQLPEHIKSSKFLTGNQLGLLGSIDKLPTPEEINNVKTIYKNSEEFEKIAINLLEKGEIFEAFCLLI